MTRRFELHPPPRPPDEDPPSIGLWLAAVLADEYVQQGDDWSQLDLGASPFLQGFLRGLLKVKGAGPDQKDARGDVRRLLAFIEQHDGVSIVVVP